jgi:hypothetical protein
MTDDDRPYSRDPVKVWECQTVTWELDNFPKTLGEIREGLREWVDHPFFDQYPPYTRVKWKVSKEEGRVDMELSWCVFDDTPRHLAAALADGDDDRYIELLETD